MGSLVAIDLDLHIYNDCRVMASRLVDSDVENLELCKKQERLDGKLREAEQEAGQREIASGQTCNIFTYFVRTWKKKRLEKKIQSLQERIASVKQGKQSGELVPM